MSGVQPVPMGSAEPILDLDDIQGIVLRSYRMPFLRVLALTVRDAAGAKTLLKALTDGEMGVQNAAIWERKPAYCVNAGITAAGLKALGLPGAILATFPPEFLEGAVARAAVVGDTGRSAPELWIAPFNTSDAHILLTVSAASAEVLNQVSARLMQIAGGAASATACPDGILPKDHRAHFGYVDGISQPRIAGLPRQKPDAEEIPEFTDPMNLVPPGAFVLGHESQHPGHFYPGPDGELGRNGSFAALRVLEQDCAAFENFLDESARATGLDKELIAAKLCGRWRNGVPLALSPDSDKPADLPLSRWNEFDYADDPGGKRCPLGAHIRRNNPRRASVAGGGGERHRLMRRGLPYGEPYNPANPDDGIERGLLALFVCGNLRDQFEFLMKEWVNDGDFAGLGTDRDPILGSQPPAGGRFRFPQPGKPQAVIRGMSSFVTTRAAAYCFLPSRTGLRFLAELP